VELGVPVLQPGDYLRCFLLVLDAHFHVTRANADLGDGAEAVQVEVVAFRVGSVEAYTKVVFVDCCAAGFAVGFVAGTLLD